MSSNPTSVKILKASQQYPTTNDGQIEKKMEIANTKEGDYNID
jgi:hypothetical protein